jgi:L-methionine (R)-S-oxide reductase
VCGYISEMAHSNELEELLSNNWLSNLSNFSAFVMSEMKDLNWVGFYLKKEKDLFLGPFQGKTACLHIPEGKGVCGHAAQMLKTVVVKDVHEFPGHIACDPNSRSELVIPMIWNGNLLGVLDVDSPRLDRFQKADVEWLEILLQVLIKKTAWPESFSI